MAAASVFIALGAAAIVGLVMFGGEKKKTAPTPSPPSPRIFWTSGNCGTADQLNTWFASHPERFSGAVNTASQLPSKEEIETTLGLTPSLVVAVEDECAAYLWNGTTFNFDPAITAEMRQAVGV